MQVYKIEFTDVFAANCYFYIDETSKHGFIIDPSAHTDRLLKMIYQNNWTIEKVLLTHSHLDHIGAVLQLADALNIKFYGAETAAQYLSNPAFAMHFTDFNLIKNISPLQDGEFIPLKVNPQIILKAIFTPGHGDSTTILSEKEYKLS